MELLAGAVSAEAALAGSGVAEGSKGAAAPVAEADGVNTSVAGCAGGIAGRLLPSGAEGIAVAVAAAGEDMAVLAEGIAGVDMVVGFIMVKRFLSSYVVMGFQSGIKTIKRCVSGN